MKMNVHRHLVFGGGTQKTGLFQILASEYVHKRLEIVSFVIWEMLCLLMAECLAFHNVPSEAKYVHKYTLSLFLFCLLLRIRTQEW